MTDKELLELAAKAARIEFGWQHIFDDYEGSTSEKWDWNPLTDDGDALRLAVKLELLIHVETCYYVQAIKKQIQATEHIGNDGNGCLYAATRRAIVRAAAAIGKTK